MEVHVLASEVLLYQCTFYTAHLTGVWHAGRTWYRPVVCLPAATRAQGGLVLQQCCGTVVLGPRGFPGSWLCFLGLSYMSFLQS